MAKKKVLRKRRVKAQKKPEPLPKSVQALLRYLGGSDVKVASSARQPAMVAQQFAPQQQPFPQQAGQGQPQQQPQRKRQIGQVVALSPLGQLAPAPPPPTGLTPEQKKTQLEAEAKAKVKAEIKQKGKEEATAKVAQLEQSLTTFKQQAGQVAVQLSEGIRKSLKASEHYQGQDYNPLDSEVDMSPTPRPYIAEQGLQVNTFSVSPLRARSLSATQVGGAYVAKEVEAGQGAYAASQYVKAVSNPEMTPKGTIRGRPRLTEQQKLLNAEARKLEKAQRKELLKTTGEQLYQEGQSATKALEALTSTIAQKKAEKPKLKLKVVGSMAGVDPSTQVEFLASGGGAAAQPVQLRGMNISELGGGGAAKK